MPGNAADRPGWAWEKDHGFDAQARQRKEACLGVAACPACGKNVALVAETEAWTRDGSGRWVHAAYSPAAGVCCGKLVVDSFDGCRVYDLRTRGDDR